MRILRYLVAVALAICCTTLNEVSASGDPRPARWTIEELPVPRGYAFGEAVGINEKNVIVGSVHSSGSTPIRAVKWVGYRANLLRVPVGSQGSIASAINDRGVVSGSTFRESDGRQQATMWTPQGTPVVLPALSPRGESRARAINNRGFIVGDAEAVDGSTHAVVWRNGIIRDLGTLPDAAIPYTTATGISSNGQIAGTGASGSLTWGLAVTWSPDGSRTDLPVLVSQGDTNAHGINDRGDIVGFASADSGFYHAALWRKGRIVDLGVWSPGGSSQANAINNSGAVVGTVANETTGSVAALWWKGSATPLGNLNTGDQGSAYAINERMTITGVAYADNDPRPVVWTFM